MENVNDIYFDGHYKDIWRTLIPAELTPKEAEFMIRYFNLQPGSKVLDIMCGYGRHAIALAKKGVEVTAVDNLPDYINEINETAKKENLSLKAFKADVIQYRTDEKFDLALCMGNSLNFFPPEETQQLLSSISSCLVKNGHLLINTWSLTEIAVKSFKEKAEMNVNGINFLAEAQYLFHPTRIETITVMTSADGTAENKKAIDYIFSVAEIETMLNKAGFVLKEIYSIPERKKFALGEPRAYIIAQKK
ncbi:MAG: class I SAM-dependent methyltransferase [Chitinophagaceae bacterium]